MIEENKLLRKEFETLGKDIKQLVGLEIDNLKQELI